MEQTEKVTPINGYMPTSRRFHQVLLDNLQNINRSERRVDLFLSKGQKQHYVVGYKRI